MMTHSTTRILVSTAALLLAAFAVDPIATRAKADILVYDVDFGTPPHVVGLPPVTGGGSAPRKTISSIDGMPTVVASSGPLVDQPCEFNSFDGQGDGILLDLVDFSPGDISVLECRLALTVMEAASAFVVALDRPGSQAAILFLSDGKVLAVPGGHVGAYSIGSIVELRVELELGADAWRVYLDDVLGHAGSFGGATQVLSVLFTTGQQQDPPGIIAGVDDIRVTALGVVGTESTSWGSVKALFR